MEQEFLKDLQTDFSMQEALEESYMVSRMPYETIVSQISKFREKRSTAKLTATEKMELRRLRRIKIARDYRSRKRIKAKASLEAKDIPLRDKLE